MKICLDTDEKDRFLSNLKLYRSYIAIIELKVDLLRYRLHRKTGRVSITYTDLENMLWNHI